MLLRTIRPLVLLMIIALLFGGCSIKAPTVQSMSELKVTKFTKKEITVKGEIVFNNPNKVNLNLNEIRLQMSTNKNVLGTFYQELNAPIGAYSNFKVPFAITFSPLELGQNLVSTAISAFSKEKLKVSFKGHVQVRGKSNKVGIKVPIIYNKTLKF